MKEHVSKSEKAGARAKVSGMALRLIVRQHSKLGVELFSDVFAANSLSLSFHSLLVTLNPKP